MRILQGNQHADELASNTEQLTSHTMPPTSTHDPLYVIHEENTANNTKLRIGENTRKCIYGKREEQARHTHMKSQNTRFTANPATTAYDHVCRDHTHTDEKLSAYPMKRWHNDVKRHTTWDFV